MMPRYMQRLALAAALAFVACHRNENEALVGKWISVARAKDGTATLTEFRPNGTFTSAFEVTLHSSYRLNGNLMILSVKDAKTGRTSEDSAQVRIEGDTLYLKSPLGGNEQPMQRLSSRDVDSPIVGKWGSGMDGPRPVFAEFTKDGRMSFQETLRKVQGTYSVSGATLTLSFEGGRRETGKFRFENGVLVLTPEKGPEQRLTRTD
jgi:hypothetical protein